MTSVVSEDLLARAARLATASLYESAETAVALPASLRPLDPARRLAGRAFPVICAAGDNLALHHALYAAAAGDVLVVQTLGGREFGYWGEVMTVAAQARGLRGLVIAASVRDRDRIVQLGYPVYAEGLCIRGTRKDPTAPHGVGGPVRMGGAIIQPGALIVGDADGLAMIEAPHAEAAIARAEEREAAEAQTLERIRGGARTLDIYALPQLAIGQVPVSAGARRSVEVPGLQHGDLPIPTASRIGNVLATGGVRGVDPTTGQMPGTVAEQARLMFANLRSIVEAGGARCEDILKITVWVTTAQGRGAINDPWTEMFPDPASRPSRHILVHELPAGMQVQCEALAVIP